MIIMLKHHRNPVISPDCIADVLTLGRNPKPTVRDANLKLVGGNPSFVVLRNGIIEKGFEGGEPNQRNSTPVFNLVLMDGGNVCFAASLKSSLSDHHLAEKSKALGSTITVKDHHFVWLWDETLFDFRCVMLIKDCELKDAPDKMVATVSQTVVKDEGWHEKLISDEVCVSSRVHFDVVDKVEARQEIVFLNYKMTSKNGWLWTFMEKDSMKKGTGLATEKPNNSSCMSSSSASGARVMLTVLRTHHPTLANAKKIVTSRAAHWNLHHSVAVAGRKFVIKSTNVLADPLMESLSMTFLPTTSNGLCTGTAL